MKPYSLAGILILAAALLAPGPALARFDGISGRSQSGCTGCHGNAGAVNVAISGPTTLLPDQIATYTLNIEMLSASVGGALDVGLTGGGSLSTLDANTKIDKGEVVHVDSFSSAPAGNIGDWIYDFQVTAPSTIGASLLLSAAGMAFNGDFDNSDLDIWNLGSMSISVVPEPGTALLLGAGLVSLASVRRRSLRRG